MYIWKDFSFFFFSFTIEGGNEMGELNVALVNSHRLFLISGRQPSEKRRWKKKRSLCKRGESNHSCPMWRETQWRWIPWLLLSLSICLFLHFLLLSFLFPRIYTPKKKDENQKKKKKKKTTAILVKSERERERKRGQKYQEQDEDEVGMVVMTQYNRVAIRNVTLPSDQLSRPSLLYPTLLPLTTRFVSVTIFISSIFSIRNP